MKKKSLKSLKLNKRSISDLNQQDLKGGIFSILFSCIDPNDKVTTHYPYTSPHYTISCVKCRNTDTICPETENQDCF